MLKADFIVALTFNIIKLITKIGIDMPTDDEIPVKKVKFASEAINVNLTFSSLGKPHSASFRKKWLDYSRKGEYALLKQEISLYEKKGGTIKKFFEREGETILHWALIGAEQSQSMSFIVSNIPNELILDTLEKNNYSLVRTFLLGENGIEKYRKSNEDDLKCREEKLKLLLNVAPQPIKKILEAIIVDPIFGNGLKLSIKKVMQNSLEVFKPYFS